MFAIHLFVAPIFHIVYVWVKTLVFIYVRHWSTRTGQRQTDASSSFTSEANAEYSPPAIEYPQENNII